MPDAPHVLMIYPEQAGRVIQLDHVVYSHNPSRKSHLGAILGGVLGGVAVAVILSLGALFLRCRERKRQLSTRGIRLSDHWAAKPSLKMVEAA
ncbi:hypothetical protein B0H10DRAFT_2228785 [Mycena sp. CBHHK59/15]|nr:hypothetical protein B0H10DRAFT_2228785 [Mycena sp. CBHHK59/15]